MVPSGGTGSLYREFGQTAGQDAIQPLPLLVVSGWTDTSDEKRTNQSPNGGGSSLPQNTTPAPGHHGLFGYPVSNGTIPASWY
ncbi:hypothetical protein MNBD_ACTINO02-1789 [hydrothermal vent metagenome]|uniref:Uncharacterized protein n=1 Tax=hydrothermal vent metagenome TaxID=652676 RepID=A0A3B0T0P6_9ZZZZ